MPNTTYYVKSCEEDHCLKTLVDNKKEVCQTLEEVVTSKTLKPNTKSFGQELRLSTTILHDNYLKTYRPQGIIFETEEKPEYILPFDLVLLSNTDKIVVHYYRIKDNLHLYYNHTLIPGYEKFIFTSIDELISTFKSPKDAWKAANMFRIQNGLPKLPQEKFRVCEYNEAVFIKPIQIKPIAIFGYRAETKALAKKLNLPWYRSAKAFYVKMINNNN